MVAMVVSLAQLELLARALHPEPTAILVQVLWQVMADLAD